MTTIRSVQRLAAAMVVALVATLPTSTLSAVDDAPAVRVRIFGDRQLQRIGLTSRSGLRIGTDVIRTPLQVQVSARHLLALGDSFRTEMPSLTVSALHHDDLVLKAGNDERRLTGLLRLSVRRGSLQIVNVMPTETYVLGIIEPELGSVDLYEESLKAQIVASRSYLMSMRGRHGADGYDFCDGPHCQAFGGLAAIKPRLLAIAAAVHDQYLEYDGRVIPAFYHDSCGGMTAAAEDVWPVRQLPYLRAVRDGESDAYCRFAPRAHWRVPLNRLQLRRLFVRAGLVGAQEPFGGMKVVRRDASGRVQTVELLCRSHTRVSGAKVRRMINGLYGAEVVKSTLFSVVQNPGAWALEGRGWGHGVGLCQWGAIQMAKEGKSYREILSHYYPGAYIGTPGAPMYASNTSNGG